MLIFLGYPLFGRYLNATNRPIVYSWYVLLEYLSRVKKINRKIVLDVQLFVLARNFNPIKRVFCLSI